MEVVGYPLHIYQQIIQTHLEASVYDYVEFQPAIVNVVFDNCRGVDF